MASPLVDQDSSLNGLGKKCICAHFFARKTGSKRGGDMAKEKRAALPSGYDKNFEICRRFFDQHAGR